MKIRVDPLDRLFSKYVRLKAGEKCERCGHYTPFGNLQVSHYHGRAKRSTRYDEENVTASCFACHMYFHAHPLEHTEFMIRRLGQQGFDMLTARANTPARYVDINAITLYLREKLSGD